MYTYYKSIEKVGYTMSVKNITKISNPLTIVFLFAAIAEIAMTITIFNISEELQKTFLWFVMLFPILLMGLFFGMWFFKPHYLYAPGDYKNEENFIRSIGNPIKISDEKITNNFEGIADTKSDVIEMEEIVNKTFSNQQVTVDNKSYFNCEFINCEIVYSAEGMFKMRNNQFESCYWQFSGKAAETLSVLQSIYHGMGEGGKEIIETTFENIKKSNLGKN